MEYSTTAAPREAAAPSGATRPVVAHVISGLFFGGGQRVTLDLVRELPRVSRWSADLCLLGQGSAAFANHPVTVIAYGGRYDRPREVLGAARELREWLRRRRPEMLHCHGWDAVLITILANLFRKTRIVVHWHTTDTWLASPRFRHRLRRWITRWLLSRRGVRVVAVSQAVAIHLREHLPAHGCDVAVILNGIDVKRFAGAPTRDPGGHLVVGTAARLEPMKGLGFLLEAVARCRRENLDIQLRVAGTGSETGALEELARDLGIAPNVRFLGHQVDMRAFYGELDAFVLPSVSTEGLPLVLLEAMAAGLPVVATRIAGTPEAICDRVSGLLVPSRNADALARALTELASSADLRRSLSREAGEAVHERFTLERFAAEIADLYETMLRSPETA